jgi:pyruvate,orthophosphate dikinase
MSDNTLPAVHAFEDPLPAGVQPTALLGGKAAGLAVMARDLGMPVPPGFVVTTRVCNEFLAHGWPAGLDDEIRAQLGRLAERTGRTFGDSANPLLVSVRSGAPVSMPGMMDTLLNVGMTPAIRERLAAESGNREFAADTWLRFNRMYAEIVLGIPHETALRAAKNDGTEASILAAAERVRGLAAPHGGIPEEPFEQLIGAIRAVFGSWQSERAIVFRQHENIPASLGTAATVQAMVFGNLDDRSGTGVAFTRDPATGDSAPRGDYLARAQGEDVVAGTHKVGGLDALAAQLPDVHAELLSVLQRLERHYRDMCDVEFTVSDGKLYLLQARVGRRSPLAAVRIAVAMAEDEDFPVLRSQAVARVNEETLRELAKLGRVAPGHQPIASGLAVSPGVGSGVLCCDADRAAELAEAGVSVILARPETSPSDVHGMVAAAGLVTTLGGMVSHAAVVARGWAIPAICSLAGATVERAGLRTAAGFFPEGDTVTVDGTTGRLYAGDVREAGGFDFPELRKLRTWALELQDESSAVPEAAAQREPTALELLRTIQLKGLCSVDRIAACLGVPDVIVEAGLAPHAAILKTTPRGYALTPDGRGWVLEQVALEAAELPVSLESEWERFVELNGRFKALVTECQQAGITGADHERWDWLLQTLEELHRDFRPVMDGIAEKAIRLATYGPRFDAALQMVRGGDHSMVASPLKDSYHTVWFELHEELIALTGRNRAAEERANPH